MIEIHAHVLPGLDDGPVDSDEAFALIAAYARQGVSDLICTSHFTAEQMQKDHSQAYLARYATALSICNEAFMQSEYTIRLHPGFELELVPDLYRCLHMFNQPPYPLALAGSSYLLVELPRWLNGGIGTLDNLLYSLQLAGYMPILAHPERIVDFESSELQLVRWVEQERIFLQVNATSLVELPDRTSEQQKRYQRRHAIVDRLIRSGLVHVVSSDAHHVVRRPPLHQLAWTTLSEQYGEASARLLLQDNPAAILAGRLMISSSQAAIETTTSSKKQKEASQV